MMEVPRDKGRTHLDVAGIEFPDVLDSEWVVPVQETRQQGVDRGRRTAESHAIPPFVLQAEYWNS